MSRTELPHSWSLNTWPPSIYPHTPERARYLLRSQSDSLTKAGALSRVGRELVVLGERYGRWLERQASNVPGFVPNTSRASAARPGAPSLPYPRPSPLK